MENVTAFAVLGLLVVTALTYQWALGRGIRPRTIATSLDDDTLRRLFTKHVAGSTWKIVADGEPMVAQSSLVTGIRQQIAMQLGDDPAYPGRTVVRISVVRTVRKLWGTPTKAHTLRIRLNAFMRAVKSADRASIDLTDGDRSRRKGSPPVSSPVTAPESTGPASVSAPIITYPTGLSGPEPDLPGPDGRAFAPASEAPLGTPTVWSSTGAAPLAPSPAAAPSAGLRSTLRPAATSAGHRDDRNGGLACPNCGTVNNAAAWACASCATNLHQ